MKLLTFAFGILLCVSGAALPQEPAKDSMTATSPNETKPPTPGPVSSDQNAAPANPPLIVNVLPTPKTESEQEQERHERAEKADTDRRLVDLTADLARFTQWLAYATIALVLATAGLVVMGIKQAGDMKASIAAAERSANASRDQLSLTFPPRLRVANIVIHPRADSYAPVILEPGNIFRGQIPVVNSGREYAVLGKTLCMPFWHKGLLPTYRPYFRSKPQGVCESLKRLRGGDDFRMEPGDIHAWEYETTVPADYGEGMNLYILGYIEYSDRLTPNRVVVFARRYDVGKGRFIAVDDPDYESQDYQ